MHLLSWQRINNRLKNLDSAAFHCIPLPLWQGQLTNTWQCKPRKEHYSICKRKILCLTFVPSAPFMLTHAGHLKTAFSGAVPPLGEQSPFSPRKPPTPHNHHLSHPSDGCSCSAGHTVTEIPASAPSQPFCELWCLFLYMHRSNNAVHFKLCAIGLNKKIHDWNQVTTQLNITKIHQVKIIRPLLPQMTQDTHYYVILPSLGICPVWKCPEKTPVSHNDIELLECLFQVQVDKAIHKLINSRRWAERFLMKPEQ